MEIYFELVRQGMNDFSLAHLAWYMFIVALCILSTAVFSVADAVSGIYTAWKRNEPIRSHLLRKTVEKMSVYWFYDSGRKDSHHPCGIIGRDRYRPELRYAYRGAVETQRCDTLRLSTFYALK